MITISILNSRLKNLIIFLGAVLIGILLGVGLIYLTKKKSNYYAVFLNNGAIYFGKLSIFPKLKLNDAIFIQVDQQGQASLQKFKNAFWRPKGTIYLNRNSILFIAPLDKDSPLINMIEQTQPLPQFPQQQPQQSPNKGSAPTSTPNF
jgi:hypothetical protein